jgi:lysozyme
MKISDAGIKLLTRFEGCVLNVYKDAAGLDTIGIGHLVKPGETFESPFTREAAENLLRRDVADAESAVNRSVTIALNAHQFDACCSLAFNIGGGAFSRSSLVKAINAQRWDECPQLFMLWNKAGGKVLQGLVMRRSLEAAMFMTPMPTEPTDTAAVMASVYETSSRMVGELVARDMAFGDTDPPPDDAA